MNDRQIFCQYCGSANNANARYCHSCNRELIVAQPPQQQAYTPPPQQMYAPPPVQQVFVQQAPAQKGSKSCIWIVGIATFLVLCCAVGGYTYYSLMLAPIRNTANDFLGFLQAQNYAQAYNLCDADLQKEIGSPDGLKNFIESNGFVVQTWSLNNVQRIDGAPITGFATGQVTFANGKNATVKVSLAVDKSATWKVIGIKFNW